MSSLDHLRRQAHSTWKSTAQPVYDTLTNGAFSLLKAGTKKLCAPIFEGVAESATEKVHALWRGPPSTTGEKSEKSPIPQELVLLSTAIKTYLGSDHLQKAAGTLLTAFKRAGLSSTAEQIEEQFEFFSQEDAELIISLQESLQDFLEGNEMEEVFDVELQRFLVLCQNYGRALRTLVYKHVDKTLDEAVANKKEALACLNALLTLEERAPEQQKKSVCEQTAFALYPLYTESASEVLPQQQEKMSQLAETLISENPQFNIQQVQAVQAIVQAIPDPEKAVSDPELALIKKTQQQATRLLQQDTPSPSEGSSSSSISSMIQEGHRWFKILTQTGQNAVIEQATRTLSTLFIHCFAFISERIDTTSKHRQLIISILQPCIEQLQNAQKEGKWSTIKNALEQCFSSFQHRHVQMYLQGISLPFNPTYSASPVPDMLSIARSHKQNRAQPQAITAPMVDKMALQFEMRSIAYVSIQSVAILFGIPLSVERVSHLLRIEGRRELSEHPTLFRTRFFDEIDSTSVNTLNKWGAKCVYVVMHACSSVFIHSIIHAVKADILEWTKRPLDTKIGHFIHFFCNYFAVLSGAYTSVARTAPEGEKFILPLLKQAVNNPERNNGLTPEELYGAVISTALKFVRVNWTDTIHVLCDKSQISPHSPFAVLNPVIDVMHFIFKKTLQIIIFLPEMAVNYFLQKTTAWVILSNVQVHAMVNNQTDKMGKPLNATAFALNEYFLTKLQQIIGTVRMRLNQIDDSEYNLPPPDHRLNIGTLIHSILEVLHKTRKRTVQQLRQHDQSDRTILEGVQREGQEYALPLAEPSVATTLFTTLHTSLSEESLRESMFHTFRILDGTFDPQAQVTQLQFQAVEKGIGDLVDELIDALIKRALDDSWDLNNTRQRLEVRKFITAFREQTDIFITHIQRCYQTIQHDPSSQKKGAAIREMHVLIDSFLINQANALQKAGVNDYLCDGTKSELNRIFKELTARIKSISGHVLEMNALQTEIDANTLAANAYCEGHKALNQLCLHLKLSLSEMNPREVQRCVIKLNGQIHKLNSYPLHDEQFISLHNQLKANHSIMMTEARSISDLQKIVQHWTGFLALKQDKQTTVIQISRAYTQLTYLINELPDRMNLLHLLSVALNHNQPDELASISQQFLLTSRRLCAAHQHSLHRARLQIIEIAKRMEFYFGREELARHEISAKQQSIATKNDQLQQNIAAFRTWRKHVRVPPIVNVDFCNFTGWARQEIHALSVWQAKKVFEELRIAMIQPHVFECMTIEALKVFLKIYGPEHFKKP